MDVAVKLDESQELLHLLIQETVKAVVPIIKSIVATEIEKLRPKKGLTQEELGTKLHLDTRTDAFKRIAFNPKMPRYYAGNDGAKKSDKRQMRWYEGAVDKFMETYTEV
ncbi:hypothetical protein FC12_GL001754 [Lacticaseibacillus paracasei subsp. tolerans DSM 20258]|jgi:hypothetical protein|uniref:hypothetical protein n=1 Tax=Lacticaseibacillus paracasei TaxID=1597 RepID=UPI0006F1580B|nr:hypothetical protein [Lacticaseibacillus paracasei]KRN08357.1 hypothetical protein FC12_GL001754 [Lacticaseibacillus paracasei subsp. tolerans DSM 20258]MCP9304606.1 hypothetical protein [Lacticaseibacillus paracasei]MCT3363846.1 hypothetical protein [Lacticaseibacillus paracasei]GEL37326.1 hypothetical protein LPA06_01770 [Lacticaseibacillus paracasei subsp. tolerans]